VPGSRLRTYAPDESAPVIGNNSVIALTVLDVPPVVSHAVPDNLNRGDIWTGTPAVAAVVLVKIVPSVEVITSAVLVLVSVLEKAPEVTPVNAPRILREEDMSLVLVSVVTEVVV